MPEHEDRVRALDLSKIPLPYPPAAAGIQYHLIPTKSMRRDLSYNAGNGGARRRGPKVEYKESVAEAVARRMKPEVT